MNLDCAAAARSVQRYLWAFGYYEMGVDDSGLFLHRYCTEDGTEVDGVSAAELTLRVSGNDFKIFSYVNKTVY